MKFKVGEKVRVREDLEVGKDYGSLRFNSLMAKLKGQIFEVESINYANKLIELKGEKKFYWTDEMLEPVEEKLFDNWLMNGDFMNQGHGQLSTPGKRAIKNIIGFNEKNCDTCKNYNTYFDCSQCNDFDEWEKAEEKEDLVNHPKHYNMYRVEVIDIIEDATKELKGMEAVNLGHIIRYVLRYQFKNGVQDLKKARFYLDKQIKYLEDKQ